MKKTEGLFAPRPSHGELLEEATGSSRAVMSNTTRLPVILCESRGETFEKSYNECI